MAAAPISDQQFDRWNQMVDERDRFKTVLEDIAVGRWNTGSRHLNTQDAPGLTANEYAAAALNPNVPVYKEGQL